MKTLRHGLTLLCLLFVVARPSRAQAIEELGQNIHDIPYVAGAASVVADSGAKWVRLIAWWRWMQPSPSPSPIDFSQLDQRVDAARQRGLSVLITFTSIPSWANGTPSNCDFWAGGCSAPLTNPTAFPNFVTAVVNRYKDRVKNWEIWNEPDYKAFWTGTLTQWRDQILIPGTAAIRGADNLAKIAGPATYSSLTKFQNYVWESCSRLDYLSVHFYLGSVGNMFSRLDNSYLPWIQANCNKPLWVTETGIDSKVVGEQTQASEYVAAYSGSIARSGVAKMFLFQWKDNDCPTGPGCEGWGIIENAQQLRSPKRSFWQIQDYALALQGSSSYTMIRDTFANSTSRPVGSQLNAQTTEMGSKAWSANPTVVLGTSEVTTSIGGSAAHIAGVPFAPPVNPSRPVNKVEADVVVTGTDWIALGFNPTATGGFWGAEAWVHLGPGGHYSVYVNGVQNHLATGTAPIFYPTGLNHLMVKHQRSLNELTVEINGFAVLLNRDLDVIPFVPSLAYAGFHIQTQSGSEAGKAIIDSFRVLSTP